MADGTPGLQRVGVRLFVPLLPTLAELSQDFAEVFGAHGGRTALEFKYDGARIQLHKSGDLVRIWSRGLTEVTASLPDCLMLDGRALIDEPYETRWTALEQVTGGAYLARRIIPATTGDAEAFLAEALAAGHEGIMAKALDSPYAPGSRGKRWFKVKPVETVDCVIVAADWGSGRRRGWLSNYRVPGMTRARSRPRRWLNCGPSMTGSSSRRAGATPRSGRAWKRRS